VSSQLAAYRPMSLVDLAGYLRATRDDGHRWRLIAEFLEEYRHEAVAERWALLDEEPPSTGNERWDVFLAALAEHLATHDDRERRPGSRTVACKSLGSRSTARLHE
jgi:hypothetical protein